MAQSSIASAALINFVRATVLLSRKARNFGTLRIPIWICGTLWTKKDAFPNFT
jgi:hypothetical protein